MAIANGAVEVPASQFVEPSLAPMAGSYDRDWTKLRNLILCKTGSILLR
ncbi:hypothetical protein CP97_14720 [Aurantiacibacter atlanticus]|uniref:Uncharacterized protein n=1 Tax=Aurantiacibacter atlanticus TaxID=1648404 RepID=A0A168M1E9_9SPHN|nr:hypothetical protein CP97_14720 [Aurantiacibacter atlanticus]